MSEPSGDIQVRCYHSLDEAASLRAEVNTLNLRSARPDPFSTFEFLEVFLANRELRSSARVTLWFLTAVKAGRLLGFVALSHERRSFLGVQSSKIGFAVTHDNDRPHVVARQEDLAEVSKAFLQYLVGRKREWSLLEFQQQDDASSLFPVPDGVARNGLAIREWPGLANGTIHVIWRTFPDYLRALTKKNRSNSGRQMRNLLAAGKVEVLSSSDPGITPVLFELYRSVEPRSWKSIANATIGRNPHRIAYFRAILDSQQPMRISIHVLLLDEVPVAGLICGSFLDGLYALHIVYDAGLTAMGPGSLMLLMGIRHAIQHGAACFNLLSGFGYFKVRWLASMTETRTGQVYRVDRPPFWRRLGGDALRWASRAAVDRSPARFNPARRATNAPRALDERSEEAPCTRVGAAERAHLVELIARVRRGSIETVSAAALAALWATDGAVTPSRTDTRAMGGKPERAARSGATTDRHAPGGTVNTPTVSPVATGS